MLINWKSWGKKLQYNLVTNRNGIAENHSTPYMWSAICNMQISNISTTDDDHNGYIVLNLQAKSLYCTLCYKADHWYYLVNSIGPSTEPWGALEVKKQICVDMQLLRKSWVHMSMLWGLIFGTWKNLKIKKARHLVNCFCEMYIAAIQRYFETYNK